MYDFTNWTENRSLTCMADSFDPPFIREIGGWGQPVTRVKSGTFYQPDGDILLRIYAPSAGEVSAEIRNMGGKSPSVTFEKQDGGISEGVFPTDSMLLAEGCPNHPDQAPEATGFLKELLVPGSTK